MIIAKAKFVMIVGTIVQATVTTIVNYDRKTFIIQVTGSRFRQAIRSYPIEELNVKEQLVASWPLTPGKIFQNLFSALLPLWPKRPWQAFATMSYNGTSRS
jgi:hypothetical protein